MSSLRLAATAVVIALTAMPVKAGNGADDVSTVIRLRAFVPVLCRVQLYTAVGEIGEDGVADLGVADEFCNAPHGYRVMVQHPADLEGAAIIRNGVRIPLSAGGETVLTDSSHPDINSLSLAVDVGAAPDKFNRIGVRIEAKG